MAHLLPDDKSKILHRLEDMITNIDEIHTDPVVETCRNVIIFDGMALVNAIRKSGDIETCSDLANSFINMLINKSRGFHEVRLVFDRYVENSLKEQMRVKRTHGKSTYYHVTDSTLIRYISLKEFLSDIRTKGELCEYLADKVLQPSKSSKNMSGVLFVTDGTRTRGNIDVTEDLQNHNQEEADTLILLHALSLDKRANVVVESPDTDVFLLMISMYHLLPPNISFKTGKGDKTREIDIGLVCQALGEKHALALLGFHALTGTDVSGKFAGRTKEFCFKIFLSCEDDILHALAILGTQQDLPTEIYETLERFVCLLYKSKKYSNVSDLRWHLYSNRQAEAESLPPTRGSLELHIMRANFVTMVWKKANESIVSFPSACDFGWETGVSGRLIPIRCKMPPAPEAITNLIKCGYRGCTRNCSCRKNKLSCTEICNCFASGCNNEFTKLPDDALVDDDDEY